LCLMSLGLCVVARCEKAAGHASLDTMYPRRIHIAVDENLKVSNGYLLDPLLKLQASLVRRGAPPAAFNYTVVLKSFNIEHSAQSLGTYVHHRYLRTL